MFTLTTYSVPAVTAIGVVNNCCCQPLALSLVNVTEPNNCPLAVHTRPTCTVLDSCAAFQNRIAVNCPSTSATTRTPSSYVVASLGKDAGVCEVNNVFDTTLLVTVTVTVCEAVWFAPSRAMAVTECEPLVAVVLSHVAL